MSEDRLARAAAEGVRARQLLKNDLLVGAFKGLEEAYTAAWRHTLIDDVAAREKLFLAINIVGKVSGHLTSLVTNGRLAENELRQLAETAERKRRFGIM